MAKKQKESTITTIMLHPIGRAVLSTFIRVFKSKIQHDHKDKSIEWAEKEAEKLFETALDSGKIIQWGCVGISRNIPAFEGTGSVSLTIKT